VVITPKGTLIVGARRLAACRQLGWRAVLVTVVDVADLLRAEHDENVVRRDFLPSEAVSIAEALEQQERAAAKARRLGGLRRGLVDPRQGNCPQRDEGTGH
jgi:ParB-like chromosome segregation protein Spo0J